MSGPLVSIVVGAVAFGLYQVGVRDLTPLEIPFALPFAVACLLSAGTELFLIRIRFERETLVFALSDMVLVLLLFLVTPFQMVTSLILGRLIGRIVYHLVIVREAYPPGRLTFDVVSTFLEGVLALLAFSPVVRLGEPLGPAGWLGAYWATFATSIVMGLILEVIQLIDGVRPSLRRMRGDFGFSLGLALPTTSVALIAVTVLWREPGASWLLFVLAGLLAIGYRAYTAQLPGQDSLRYLYATARQLQEADDPDEVLLNVLDEARDLVRADLIELVMLPAGQPARRTWVGANGAKGTREPVLAGADLELWAATVAEGRPHMLRGDEDEPPRLTAAFATLGLKFAMVTPLPGRGMRGVLVIRNRAGTQSSFDPEELELLEALANHLSVAFERARLLRDLESTLERIHDQAVHDDLTRLPNRVLLHERVAEALAAASEGGPSFAVLLLDLDGFKQVNDSLGHAAGDELLTVVADRLRAGLRPGDTPARLGGDEFAVLLPGAGDPDEVRRAGRRLLTSVSEPIGLDHDGHPVRAEVGVSIGAVIWDGHADNDEVLRDADAAMYAAKEAGKGRIVVFEPSLRASSRQRVAIEAGLRQAVEAGTVEVVYEPVVAANTGRVVALCARPCWTAPGGRVLAGGALTEVAGEAGLTVQLGRRVLERALADLHDWRAAGDGRTRITVSVPSSLPELSRPELAGEVGQLLAQAGLSPQHLELEVAGTELISAGPAAIAGLRTLAGLGVHLAASGFGIGSVALTHLDHLPVTALRLDASSVAGLSAGPEESAVAEALIRLALSSELPVVADGVAAAGQLQTLRALRCTFVQGPYIGPPLAAAEVPGVAARAAGLLGVDHSA